MGEKKLDIGACERERKSGRGQQTPWLTSSNALLVHACQHDEAVHEQQSEAAASHPEDQQCDVDLPAHPSAKEEAAQAAFAPDASAHGATRDQTVVHQRAYAVGGSKIIVFVLALDGTPASRVGRVGAAA